MTFTIQHFIALLPLLITSATLVVVMLAVAWKRNHSFTATLSVIGLNLAPAVAAAGPRRHPDRGDTAGGGQLRLLLHGPGAGLRPGLRDPRPRLQEAIRVTAKSCTCSCCWPPPAAWCWSARSTWPACSSA